MNKGRPQTFGNRAWRSLPRSGPHSLDLATPHSIRSRAPHPANGVRVLEVETSNILTVSGEQHSLGRAGHVLVVAVARIAHQYLLEQAAWILMAQTCVLYYMVSLQMSSRSCKNPIWNPLQSSATKCFHSWPQHRGPRSICLQDIPHRASIAAVPEPLRQLQLPVTKESCCPSKTLPMNLSNLN